MAYPFQIKSLEEYKAQYQLSLQQPENFWGDIAQHFIWKKKWGKVCEWNFTEPRIEYFKGAQLNITENCLDRHAAERPDQAAFIWESNHLDEPSRSITYIELLQLVNQFCHVLHNNGVRKGDRVCLYMGMIPELAISMLACARIGAIHSVIFAGFSARSIADRIQDAQASFVITCDGTFRGSKSISLKALIDEALEECSSVQKVIVYNRTNLDVPMKEGRDSWWHDEIEKIKLAGLDFFEATAQDAEDPLFILYTSGSTGKPKGVVHTTAGYMIWATYTFVNVFQYQPKEIFFCSADIGWVTGHSYIVYGPLSAGATVLMFEGVPTYPDATRFWQIIDKHQVNILYTAPTAIRSLMSYGTEIIQPYKLNSLRVIGTVGEPINEEAWHWYNEHIGKGRCPIVDTWWQTETGGTMMSNLAGITPSKPTFATLPLPGVWPALMDEKGNEIEGNVVSGNLAIKAAWPGILRTTYGDHERMRQTYFTAYPNYYFTGDGALRDAEGHYRITGRVDDVLNVSGHRIGTAELENALNMHDVVLESAVVGYPHDVKGQGIYAYVFCTHDEYDESQVIAELMQIITKEIGAIAKPDKIQFVKALPKTRSGKIMRRILRKIAEGEMGAIGDTSTLMDPAVVDDIIKGAR